jgi:hypothetical protein
LSDSAVQLALDDHAIDDGANIIDSRVVDELHDAGIGVDFHFGDVGAARKAEVDRIVIGLFFQTRLKRLKRIVVRHVGSERDVRERFSAIGADHMDIADRFFEGKIDIIERKPTR